MNEHTSKKFDAELEGIRTRVLQMGGMVELQIVKAMEGLSDGDLLLIDQVDESLAHIQAQVAVAASEAASTPAPAA